jgi:hypothetical protein
VIGGGDTGSDCVGTSIRQGARTVTQLEIMPQPPLHENKLLTWPNWPLKLRTSSSQEEGCERDWSVATQAFVGQDGLCNGDSDRAVGMAGAQWAPDHGRSSRQRFRDQGRFGVAGDGFCPSNSFRHVGRIRRGAGSIAAIFALEKRTIRPR